MGKPIYDLCEFVMAHAQRGSCRCGRCVDAPPVDQQPEGHTADMVFFEVSARDNPSVDKLRSLVEASKEGEYATVDVFDGKEHSYIELGAWLGDQGLALMLMGLGAVLGLWKLLTPKMLPGLPEPLVQQMAGGGLVTIQFERTSVR